MVTITNSISLNVTHVLNNEDNNFNIKNILSTTMNIRLLDMLRINSKPINFYNEHENI